jgi:hypothetical protein
MWPGAAPLCRPRSAQPPVIQTRPHARSAVNPERRSPALTCTDGPDTHPSWGRDGRSLPGVWGAGISGGIGGGAFLMEQGMGETKRGARGG